MYQLGFVCVFTAFVLIEFILASLVDRFPKSEVLERDEVSVEVCEIYAALIVCSDHSSASAEVL